jgi:hypothetical protein
MHLLQFNQLTGKGYMSTFQPMDLFSFAADWFSSTAIHILQLIMHFNLAGCCIFQNTLIVIFFVILALTLTFWEHDNSFVLRRCTGNIPSFLIIWILLSIVSYVILICWERRLLVNAPFCLQECRLMYCGCSDMYKLLSTVCDSFIFRIVEKSTHRHICVNEWNTEDEKTR